MPDARDVTGVGDQHRAGVLQSNSFLKLQGAHGRDSSKVPVKR